VVVEQPSGGAMRVLVKHGSDCWVRQIDPSGRLIQLVQFGEVNAGSESTVRVRKPTAIQEIARVEEIGLADLATQLGAS